MLVTGYWLPDNSDSFQSSRRDEIIHDFKRLKVFLPTADCKLPTVLFFL